MPKKTFYISTPIYYPSGKWHIGTCYTTVICDAIARYKRLQGYDVFYLTGTDEHGQKIQAAAEAAKIPTLDFVTERVDDLKRLWGILGISYDKFVRTTDEYHKKTVGKIFKKLFDKGDIYKGEYNGMYCAPCEAFFTPSQLADGKCPDCGREVEERREEAYFFRLSKYRDRLIDLISDTDFLSPKSRRNEMLNNFLNAGLQDLCVSRSTFDWGVKVPFDDKHIVYVWIDALSNYISALGYLNGEKQIMDRYWPCDLHMMAKEIVRFHSVIWPALLMALDLPLPKKVYGHGWLMFGGDKMSKSKGNVVDPFVLADRYSVDALRYYLLREVPFGSDGVYTNRNFLMRINGDLANDYGNLVSRTAAMTQQYFGGVIPRAAEYGSYEKELIDAAAELQKNVAENVDALDVPTALECIWKLVRRANKYVDETCPWKLAKEAGAANRLATVIACLNESIRIATVHLQAFLPETAKKVWMKLGIEEGAMTTLASAQRFSDSLAGCKTEKGEPLFARIDIEKELSEMDKLSNSASLQETAQDETAANTAVIERITIEEFSRIKLITATVIAAEKVAKTTKLLKLTVDGGDKERTIVSGIAEWYTPEEMVGKQIIIVSNLKECTLRGIISEGMILCAGGKDALTLVTPEKRMPAGTEVR